MRLNHTRKYVLNGKAILSAEIESPRFTIPKNIFFCYPEKYLDFLPDESADPFFPAMLIPSMLSGEDLEIIPPISSRLLESQQTIQDILSTWHPEEFKKINLIAKNVYDKSPEKKNRNATFFSLGVDSMYTMLKYLKDNQPPPGKELSCLIYMKGLELPLSTYSKRQDVEVMQSVKRVAAHYKLDAIIGETNIRDVFPLLYEKYYSGPCLASTALSLAEGFDHIFVPSSHSYANLSPNPSSPMLDYLWSNERLKIVHDGAEAERAEKISTLIVNDCFAMNNLRVCVENEGGNYNCGKCWKCIRTMITLKAIDRLGDCGSFPEQLPKSYSIELRTFLKGSLRFTKENLKLAQTNGNKELERILSREVRIGELEQLRKEKSIAFLVKEVLFFLFWKTFRKLKLVA